MGDALREAAALRFEERVAKNPYPGRGLVIGRDVEGDWVQVYWIMGRSEHSRNRRFVAEGSTLRTEALDPARLDDPSLIIYEAMLELPGIHLVSNGDQTRTLADALAAGGGFEEALASREREPDAPNYTPRISGMLDLRGTAPVLALSVLKANRADPEQTDRHSFRPAAPPPGFGLGLTTYEGDGSPLPSFSGEPLWLPLDRGPDALLDHYWSALDAENRVACAVKRVPASGAPGEIRLRNAG